MLKEIEYLFSLERFGIKLGLETTYVIMALLDRPEQKFRSIHVTGTNGKGSTCAFLDSVLRKTGLKVALYTSPHLIRFNERIRINGEDISDRELIYYTGIIRSKIEEENAKRTDKLQPTFFEFTTALAFLYFAEKKVDIAVIEVGMGGRLDATNVIIPLVSVITNVSYDHMEHLGETPDRIAAEKAGIIKGGVPLVTAEKNPEILAYFESVCKERSSMLYVVGNDINASVMYNSLERLEFSTRGIVEGNFTTHLLGEHQVDNACAALLALQALKHHGIDVPLFMLKDGIADARWSGRLEIISHKPLIIVDGAHNVAGMAALSRYMQDVKRRKVLVIGIAKDKEIEPMIRLIVPLFEYVVITQGNYKPADTGILRKEAEKYTKNVQIFPRVADAVDAAIGIAEKQDIVLFTGSLYMIGDALSVLRKKYSYSP